MKKIKFFILFFSKLISRYYRQILAGVFLVTALFFLILQNKDHLFKPHLSEGLIGTYTETELPPVVTQLLSKSLVAIDKSGFPKPNLAEGWSSNEESTEYIFKLRNNLVWSDGTKLKSQELLFSIPDVKVSYPDDMTVKFQLSDSYSPFATLLTKPLLKAGGMIGMGPYKITQVVKDLVFVKKIVLIPLNKDLPDIHIRFYPNEKIAKSALKMGEIQAILGVNEVENLTLEKPFGLLQKANYNRLVTIFYNTQDAILSDDNFRLGLSFSAPALPGEEEAKTPFSPHSWGYNPQVKDYLSNPEQARLYLDKVKQGKDQTITLTSTTSLKTIGEQIVSAWNQMGIKAVLRVESGIPQNFQALLIAQKIPPDPDQYSLWHKLGQTNISKYSNPRIDKDLEDGRKLKDIEARKARYQDFQKILLDHAPATFLYFPKYNIVFNKKANALLEKVIELQI